MQNIDPLKLRVKQIFNELIKRGSVRTNRDFFTPIGISDSIGSSILSETNTRSLPKKKIDTLASAWNVSKTFLQIGEGKIFLDDEELSINAKQPRLEAEPLYLVHDDIDNPTGDLGDGLLRMTIKRVPVKAYAGYMRGYQDPEFYEDLSTVTIDVQKEYRGTYLAFEVKGDSMITTDPDLLTAMALPGWLAIARELGRHQWRYKLHTHRVDTWIIVHKTEGILIKNIKEHDFDKGTITIHSLNPNYPDETLNLDDIAQIFSVVKYIVEKGQP
jgi:phage repressor protein C with HTH and peptisase S24 domain